MSVFLASTEGTSRACLCTMQFLQLIADVAWAAAAWRLEDQLWEVFTLAAIKQLPWGWFTTTTYMVILGMGSEFYYTYMYIYIYTYSYNTYWVYYIISV